MVGDVIAGSPGARAKILPGDEVFSVGNNLSHNIMAYKNLLQVPNEDLKIVVIRNEKLLMLNIRTASIR